MSQLHIFPAILALSLFMWAVGNSMKNDQQTTNVISEKYGDNIQNVEDIKQRAKTYKENCFPEERANSCYCLGLNNWVYNAGLTDAECQTKTDNEYNEQNKQAIKAMKERMKHYKVNCFPMYEEGTCWCTAQKNGQNGYIIRNDERVFCKNN